MSAVEIRSLKLTAGHQPLSGGSCSHAPLGSMLATYMKRTLLPEVRLTLGCTS